MNCKYTIDPSVDEPIMLIDKHIGFDETDGMGIDGNEFAKELLFLDSLNKKRIEVRINSVGGNVMEGMSIYNAILKTKTKVDTYNIGIAASISGVIFQAGRNRIMADYALLMIHNPMGGDKKSLAKVKESLISMLMRKSNKTEAEISKLMDATSWLTAAECLQTNLCDSIEVSSELNKPRINTTQNVYDAYLSAKTILNSFKQTQIKTMKNLTNKLNVAENATENEMVAAVDTIVNNANAAVDAAKREAEAAKANALEAEKKYNEIKAKFEDAEKAAADKAAEEAETKAKEVVNEAVKAGKIANKEEVIAKWVNLAKSDLAGAKEMLAGIAVNKSGKTIEVTEGAKDVELTNVVAQTMIELQNKHNNK